MTIGTISSVCGSGSRSSSIASFEVLSGKQGVILLETSVAIFRLRVRSVEHERLREVEFESERDRDSGRGADDPRPSLALFSFGVLIMNWLILGCPRTKRLWV